MRKQQQKILQKWGKKHIHTDQNYLFFVQIFLLLKKRGNSYLIHLILFVLSAVLCPKRMLQNRKRSKNNTVRCFHAVSFSKYSESTAHFLMCMFSMKKDAVNNHKNSNKMQPYFSSQLSISSHPAHSRPQPKKELIRAREHCILSFFFSFRLYFNQLLLQLSSPYTIHPLS